MNKSLTEELESFQKMIAEQMITKAHHRLVAIYERAVELFGLEASDAKTHFIDRMIDGTALLVQFTDNGCAIMPLQHVKLSVQNKSDHNLGIGR